MTTQTAAEGTARYMALWTTDELRNMRANTASDNLRDGFTREIERREVTAIPAPRTTVEDVEELPTCVYTGDPVDDMTEHTLPGHCGDCYAHYVMEN